MIAYADFTAAFPEFSNAADYPVPQFNFWAPQAYAQLNASRFGTEIDLAAMLFVAHQLSLSKRESAAAANHAPVGGATGALSSKSIGPVSAGYDTSVTAIPGAGPWNYTTYGQRLYKMMTGYTRGGVYRAPPRRQTTFPFGFGRR